MTFLNSMAQTLERAFMKTSISHTRQILLAQGDRSLAEAGISRARLEQGDHAWPWRDALVVDPLAAPAASRAAERASERARSERLVRAAAELARLDDRELADLGIGRGDIDRVVRLGRPGIEYPDARHTFVDLTVIEEDASEEGGEGATPRRHAA